MVKLMKALGLKTDDLIRASDPQAVEAINAKLSRKGGKPTEQDVFQEIARLNAAMPTQQGGLGMGVRNTAQERADKLFPEKGFHATGADIKQIDPAKVALSDYGTIGQGFYIDPSKNAAYSNLVARINQSKAPQNVMPLRYRDDSLYDMTGLIGPADSEGAKAATKRLKDLGYKGSKSSIENSLNEVAIFDPSLVRSRFAAFDPARVNENNLLASRLLPFALPGLLALPTDEE
jgi:hypothetical protein